MVDIGQEIHYHGIHTVNNTFCSLNFFFLYLVQTCNFLHVNILRVLLALLFSSGHFSLTVWLSFASDFPENQNCILDFNYQRHLI